ncbi:hypothetical protein KAR48_16475 [bacterium]|nr:hypothetical protein [bacterium]
MKLFKCLYIVGLLLLVSGSAVLAQTSIVKNVKFRQSGDKIIIHYDLDGLAKKSYKVSLALSDNGGRSFRIKPETLTGDIGGKVRSGKSKEIIWNMTTDYPRGLDGDQFVFAVDAEMKKGSKTPLFLLGAGAVGGAVYYFTQIAGKKERGSIELIIADF